MAKISTYPIINPPVLTDILIGSDVANSNVTKNFLVSDLLNLISNPKPYKVYTALLTQSGADDPNSQYNGDLIIGRTYRINDVGGDWTNVGAPNNLEGTWFVATGTTPNYWINGEGVEGGLFYNTGAPVVTVLENTIGNVWFTYYGVGFYNINSNGLFTANKTWQSPINYNLPNDITEGYAFYIDGISVGNLLVFQGGVTVDGSLVNTPIEIRVYN
jgi:hypothetical protein